MSLPKRIYDIFREIERCRIVSDHIVNDKTMAELENLLNDAIPINDEEVAHKNLVRSIYHSSTLGFIRYLSNVKNRASALILYTESKSMARFFELQKVVHIKWSDENSTYTVSRYIPKNERHQDDADDVDETVDDTVDDEVDDTADDAADDVATKVANKVASKVESDAPADNSRVVDRVVDKSRSRADKYDTKYDTKYDNNKQYKRYIRYEDIKGTENNRNSNTAVDNRVEGRVDNRVEGRVDNRVEGRYGKRYGPESSNRYREYQGQQDVRHDTRRTGRYGKSESTETIFIELKPNKSIYKRYTGSRHNENNRNRNSDEFVTPKIFAGRRNISDNKDRKTRTANSYRDLEEQTDSQANDQDNDQEEETMLQMATAQETSEQMAIMLDQLSKGKSWADVAASIPEPVASVPTTSTTSSTPVEVAVESSTSSESN